MNKDVNLDDLSLAFDMEDDKEFETVGFVKAQYDRARDGREEVEDIWLKNYWQWRGEHSPSEQEEYEQAKARQPYIMPIYIKITKTKVTAAAAQIDEILFSDDKLPIEVRPTPIPEGVPETVHLVKEQEAALRSQATESPYGYPGDGEDLAPGETLKGRLERGVARFKGLLGGYDVVEGPSPDKTKSPEIQLAEEAADHMNKQIQDQLAETRAVDAVKQAVLENAIYGTCVLKGPVSHYKTNYSYKQDPETKKITPDFATKLAPKLNFVSIWDVYPDPDAYNSDDCEYVVQRHLLGRKQFKSLLNLPGIDKEALQECLAVEPYYEPEDWEQHLQDEDNDITRRRYEVLEYWGDIDLELAQRLGIVSDRETDEILARVPVNIWVCGDKLLRAVANPFVKGDSPYYFIPYERHPHQLWGISIPENMRDSQTLMNTHIRLAVENLRLSGNVMLEVNEDHMKKGQNYKVYPGKIWRRTGGATGNGVTAITFPNVTQSHNIMFDKMRQLADESTGMPSYAHGQTGVSGTTRTAAGMSMLMGAAAQNIKAVIRNFDHHLLRPLGEAYYHWNMQYAQSDSRVFGDVEIVARGTAALMQREVRSQRLLSFLQLAGNPAVAPFVDVQYIIREMAKTMDLDPERVTNDMVTAQLYAELLQGAQNGQTTGPETQAVAGLPGQGVSQPGMGGINPADPTGAGGGNIGVGSAPQPGESGFSGNEA